MALARTPHKGSWRMWAISCDGVGPINGLVYVSRRNALLIKKSRYAGNDNYRVTRVKVTPDPEKRFHIEIVLPDQL